MVSLVTVIGPAVPSPLRPDASAHPNARTEDGENALGPRPGWYPTREGSHERYWDGIQWSKARRRNAMPVTHPGVADRPERVEMPEHAYRDLPRYATVPPFKMATIAFKYSVVPKVHRDTDRATLPAHLVALWPALWIGVVIAASSVLGTAASPSGDPLAMVAFWCGPLIWVALALLDTSHIKSKDMHMAYGWALVPPLQAMVRTVVANSSRILLVYMLLALCFPVTWFAPDSWIVHTSDLMGLTRP